MDYIAEEAYSGCVLGVKIHPLKILFLILKNLKKFSCHEKFLAPSLKTRTKKQLS